MEIVTYDQVDQEQVLRLNLLSLGYPLTPEMAANARRLDPRVTPEFALYAVEHQRVIAQVGLFRMSAVTREGPEEVGAVWAVCTHPEHGRRGVARILLQEAHRLFRDLGLRFVSLATSRYRVAHRLYLESGYIDLCQLAQAFWAPEGGAEARPMEARPGLIAALEPPPPEDRLAAVFERAAVGRLGFIRRPPGFAAILRAWGESVTGVLITEEAGRGTEAVGYALVSSFDPVVTVDELEVIPGVDAGQAARALARAFPGRHFRLRNITRRAYRTALAEAGLDVVHPDWGTLMLAALDGTSADARRALFGVDDDRFTAGRFDLT